MISRIVIKNYRSLRDVELRPGPLTVLIGPNGSGKSNILDALRFLKEIHSDPRSREMVTNSQLEERGGYKQVVWGGLTDEKIEFEVEFSNSEREPDIPDFRVELQDHPEPHLRYRAVPIGAERWEGPAGADGINNEYLKMANHLQSWQFYNFSPELMRKPTKVKQENVLNESGSNLSTVIHSLFSAGQPDLEEAVSMLQVMVPSVERLVSPIFGDGHTYVALKEKGVENPVGTWGLSDGTLLALALSIALVVRPEPELICIESPETGIHPQMLQAVADMLEVASRDTQVIVTTQSPYLLEWLPYESFVVVEKEEGETRLTPLKHKDGIRETIEALGARDSFYSGYLGGEP